MVTGSYNLRVNSNKPGIILRYYYCLGIDPWSVLINSIACKPGSKVGLGTVFTNLLGMFIDKSKMDSLGLVLMRPPPSPLTPRGLWLWLCCKNMPTGLRLRLCLGLSHFKVPHVLSGPGSERECTWCGHAEVAQLEPALGAGRSFVVRQRLTRKHVFTWTSLLQGFLFLQ